MTANVAPGSCPMLAGRIRLRSVCERRERGVVAAAADERSQDLGGRVVAVERHLDRLLDLTAGERQPLEPGDRRARPAGDVRSRPRTTTTAGVWLPGKAFWIFS